MIESVSQFAKDHAFNVFIILSTTFILRRFAMLFIKKLIRQAIKPEMFKTLQDEKQREKTLISTIGAGVRVALWIITGLLLLAELGINIAPLLAGAGIAGVALGFGAQSMVRDFLSGIFVITENQYRVGDVIRINNEVSGKVEKVTLRIHDFPASAMIIKITGKTAPMMHWAVTGELRKRLKIGFDKNNITIPYPQQVIHQAKKSQKTKN